MDFLAITVCTLYDILLWQFHFGTAAQYVVAPVRPRPAPHLRELMSSLPHLLAGLSRRNPRRHVHTVDGPLADPFPVFLLANEVAASRSSGGSVGEACGGGQNTHVNVYRPTFVSFSLESIQFRMPYSIPEIYGSPHGGPRDKPRDG